jgi:hypothetical protein
MLRARGFSTADLLVFPGHLVVQPRRFAAALVRMPLLEYRWPSVVVQHLVWSYRLNFPGFAAVLLELNDQLASAWVPFGKRKTFAGVLRWAGFDVVEVVHRGWEAPAPVDVAQYSQLQGRVPRWIQGIVATASWLLIIVLGLALRPVCASGVSFLVCR